MRREVCWLLPLVPAKAGTQESHNRKVWIPACAGMSALKVALSRQCRQQRAVTLDRLAHMEALLNLPHPRRGRLHHRNAEILLERFDDGERVEAGAEDVDRLRGRLVGEKLLF